MRFYFVISLLFASVAISVTEDSDGGSRTQLLDSRYNVASVRYFPTPSPVRSVSYENRNAIQPDPNSHCTSSLSCDLSELCYRNQCWPKEIMNMPSLPTPPQLEVFPMEFNQIRIHTVPLLWVVIWANFVTAINAGQKKLWTCHLFPRHHQLEVFTMRTAT